MQARSKVGTVLQCEHARPRPQQRGTGWATDEGRSLESSAAVSQALLLTRRTSTPGWSRRICVPPTSPLHLLSSHVTATFRGEPLPEFPNETKSYAACGR